MLNHPKVTVLAVTLTALAVTAAAADWRQVEPGLEWGVFALREDPICHDATLRVLRVDPDHFEVALLNASAPGEGQTRTARDWGVSHGLVAAINAAMYQNDHRTSVALMRTREHVNNPQLNSKDNCVLAFDPLDDGLPSAQIIDLTVQDIRALMPHYGTLVQSIRMVSPNGSNCWSRQPKQWSTACIGTDRQGRLLLMHSRSPYSVHDLVDMLLALPLDLRSVMYLEGGPEAQLWVVAGGFEEEHVGSFETSFRDDCNNDHAWPIPNVVGIRRRTTQQNPEPGAPPTPVAAGPRGQDPPSSPPCRTPVPGLLE